MMTGASARHDQVTVDIIAALHQQLRGPGCRPTTDDIALRTSIATLRPPDVTEACGDLVRNGYESRIVFLSRRMGGTSEPETSDSTTAVIDLPEIRARLALAGIYDAVVFEPGRAIT